MLGQSPIASLFNAVGTIKCYFQCEHAMWRDTKCFKKWLQPMCDDLGMSVGWAALPMTNKLISVCLNWWKSPWISKSKMIHVIQNRLLFPWLLFMRRCSSFTFKIKSITSPRRKEKTIYKAGVVVSKTWHDDHGDCCYCRFEPVNFEWFTEIKKPDGWDLCERHHHVLLKNGRILQKEKKTF